MTELPVSDLIAFRLAELRIARGLTQSQAARLASEVLADWEPRRPKIKYKTLSSYESGARSSRLHLLEFLALLAAYRVDVADFFALPDFAGLRPLAIEDDEPEMVRVAIDPADDVGDDLDELFEMCGGHHEMRVIHAGAARGAA